MEPEDLYLINCRESAEMAYEWANQARRHAKSIDPIAHSGVTIALNFLVTLLIITLTR